jgi:hypothetical protein
MSVTNQVKKKIFLFTSDIASFIGQNVYDFVTPFERLWKRCDSEDYNKIINTSKSELLNNKIQIEQLENQKTILHQELNDKKITKRQYTLRFNKIERQVKELTTVSETLEVKIDNIDLNQEQRLKKSLGEDKIKLVQSTTVETKDKRENISEAINKLQISDQKKKILLKESESFINKTHGTLKEDSAIEMYERRFGVKLDTSQEFFKKRLNVNSKIDWYIGGRVDGLYIDKDDMKNSYIIEVKNRTRGFFTTLRDYEKTQIHMYMYMLQIPMAKLVEKYNDQLRITVIYQDDQYLNDILHYLDIFATNFECKFLDNFKTKQQFVDGDISEKQMILRRLYLNEISKCVNEKLQGDLQSDLDDDDCLIDDDL